MKKKILVTFAAILVVAVAATLFVACDKKKADDDAPSDVSRMISAFYAGETDNFAVTFERGFKEEPFFADGKTGDTAPFSVLTVTPLKSGEYSEISYTLTGDGASVGGTLSAGTFGEFSGTADADFTPLSVTLTAGDVTEEIQLDNVLADCLGGYDAVQLARERFADRIAAEQQAGAYNREIFVKLITGDRITYYYYVSFIGEGVDYWAVLIDPATGEIVSEK